MKRFDVLLASCCYEPEPIQVEGHTLARVDHGALGHWEDSFQGYLIT